MVRKNSLHKRELFFVLGAAALWIIVTLCGSYFLLMYDNTPGKQPAAPRTWPTQSNLHRDPKYFTLVMLVHPKCSCSSASLGELARLLAQEPGTIQAEVLFVVPENAQEQLNMSDTWETAQHIPGVHPVKDLDGRIAERFNAETSGDTLLYDRQGTLLFQGGITAARGHWGDNTGAQAIRANVEGEEAAVRTTAVFGCSLFGKKKDAL